MDFFAREFAGFPVALRERMVFTYAQGIAFRKELHRMEVRRDRTRGGKNREVDFALGKRLEELLG